MDKYIVFRYRDGEYTQQSIVLDTLEEALAYKRGVESYGYSLWVFKVVG